MLDIELKNKALKMRRSGMTYREIMKEVPATKSTLSKWLTGIVLTDAQNRSISVRTNDRRTFGRAKAALTHRRNRIARETATVHEADEIFERSKDDPLFIFGVTMYWAEGSKKHPLFQFVNSDPNAIFFMSKWVEKYIGIATIDQGFRLYIHKIYKSENCEGFWSGHLGVPVSKLRRTVYKPTSHKVKRNSLYKGCVRIELNDARSYRLVMRWQKRLSGLILSLTSPHSLMDKVAVFGTADLGSTPGGGT